MVPVFVKMHIFRIFYCILIIMLISFRASSFKATYVIDTMLE